MYATEGQGSWTKKERSLGLLATEKMGYKSPNVLQFTLLSFYLQDRSSTWSTKKVKAD